MTEMKRKTQSSIGQFIRKAVLIAITGICLILGVIGLILPIIPGILFLFLGAWCLTKLSSRFASHFKQNRWAKKWLGRGTAFKKLNMGERARLSLLYTAKSVVDSAESLWQKLKGTGQKTAN